MSYFLRKSILAFFASNFSFLLAASLALISWTDMFKSSVGPLRALPLDSFDMMIGVGDGEAELPGGVGEGPLELTSSSKEEPLRESFLLSELFLLWKKKKENVQEISWAV